METETTWIDEHRASCDGASCDVCEAFEVGYSRGKVALEFELLHWDGSHPPERWVSALRDRPPPRPDVTAGKDAARGDEGLDRFRVLVQLLDGGKRLPLLQKVLHVPTRELETVP